MDGGALFKHAIVNQIINESLKRNRDNEIWYNIRVEGHNMNGNHTSDECTYSFDFKYDNELNVWIIRRAIPQVYSANRIWQYNEYHVETTELMKDYIYSLVPIEFDNFNRMYGNNADPPDQIEYALYKKNGSDSDEDIQIESHSTYEPLGHDEHSNALNNLFTLATILKTPSNIKKRKQ
jgi:hypothetical protein